MAPGSVPEHRLAPVSQAQTVPHLTGLAEINIVTNDK